MRFKMESGRHSRRSVGHKMTKNQKRKQRAKAKKAAGDQPWSILSPVSEPAEEKDASSEASEEAAASEQLAASGAASSTDRVTTSAEAAASEQLAADEERWLLEGCRRGTSQDVWANCEMVSVLIPRLLKRFEFKVEGDVGDAEDTPDDPLCLWCSHPNIGMLPQCKNCRRQSNIDLDGTNTRFTAGAPEDQIDGPPSPVPGQTETTSLHSLSHRVTQCHTQS